MRWPSLVALLAVLAGPGNAVAHSLGWAVGPSGVILHSNTSGAIWVPQASGSSADLRGVAFNRQLRGIAVGDGGAVLYTANGGATWSSEAGSTTADLRAVVFGDDATAWAVGVFGTILRTQNPRQGWSLQTSGTNLSLDGVDFIDGEIGWVVGGNGTILHTSDGGTTWSPQTSGTSAFLRDVDFVDEDSGWAVGAIGTILHTSDGGATWSAQVSGVIEDLRAVEFIDADTGWAVGDNDTLLRTLDGGATWIALAEVERPPDVYSNYRGVAFVNANRGTAVGTGFPPTIDGVALHTWTGGAKWDARAIPESAQLESVVFVVHSEHWAGGDPCRGQCEPGSQCEERPRAEFPDYPEAVQELIAWASWVDCDEGFTSAIEGTCGNGQVLITRRGGPYGDWDMHFYDSQTLRFTGLTGWTDFVTFPCHGEWYWPDPITCPDATVTAVHCGSLYSLGDPVPMPPVGTLPIEGAFFYWESVPALPAAAGIFVVAGLLLTALARLRRSSHSSKLLRKRS